MNTIPSQQTQQPDNQTTLWTTDDTAHYLKLSRKTVFNLRKKRLRFVQLGGAVRFVPKQVEEYLAQSRNLARHRARKTFEARHGGTK
jgi:excisionase family DNA binding protein